MSRDACDLNAAAAHLAADFIMGRRDSCRALLAAVPEADRPAISARVTYDLFRMRGKEVARDWVGLLYGEDEPRQPSPGECSP